MLITLASLVQDYGLHLTGVVHCGARWGEEADAYDEQGVRPVWWIEANTEIIPALHRNVDPRGHHVIEAALYDVDGAVLPFHVSNFEGQSSSLLPFGTHPEFSPDTVFLHDATVTTRTIDSLVAEHGITDCNLINLDLQGVELRVLRGGVQFLQGVNAVYSECNTAEVYKGCDQLDALDEFLASQGFQRVAIQMNGNQGWGDALWLRQ